MTIEDFKSLITLLLSNRLSPEGLSYPDKVKECRSILENDLTGFITPIIKFAITAASKVKYTIKTDNDNLNSLIDKALSFINSDYVGKVSIGLEPLKKDFFRSYWESGLVLVKVAFNEIEELSLPVTAFVVDSSSVEVEGDETKFGSFSYSVNKKNLVNNDTNHYFVYKDCSVYKKYPTPPLISRGIWVNYQIKNNIKFLQGDYLKKIVSLLWVVLKGDKNRPDLKFDRKKAEELKKDLETALKEAKDVSELEKRIPTLIGRYDTEIKIITPEMESMLTENITRSIDKDILSGLGFVTVVEGLSSRRDIVLNPKPFIHSVLDTVFLFKQFLNDLFFVISQKNKEHVKYFSPNSRYKIVTSPLNSFWTDDMMDIMRVLSDRGLLSIQSSLENFDIDFEEERKRREKEAEKGDEIVFYPRVLQNVEQQVSPLETQKLGLEPEEEIKETSKKINITEPDKDNPIKMDYKLSSDYLEFVKHYAPYPDWKSLPPRLKKSLRTIKSPRLRRAWLDAFNNAYVYYEEVNPERADELAARSAWKIVKLMGKRTEKGWILKEKYREK